MVFEEEVMGESVAAAVWAKHVLTDTVICKC